MSVIGLARAAAVRAAQSVSAEDAAAILADEPGFVAMATAHRLMGPFGLNALRRALELRSTRKGARVHDALEAPLRLCSECGGQHPARWRPADRTWVVRRCDRRLTLDFERPAAEMGPRAVLEGVVRLRRHAWAYQDLAKQDVEAVRRVLDALERRGRALRRLLIALREAGVPADLIAAMAAETYIDLEAP